MSATPSSPLEAIDTALREHNPFSQPPFVNADNVWGKGFPDVESLNAHASDAVFQALEHVRIGRYSASILITAQDGTGKTHIISRIRHRLQEKGGALFVFANKFNDLNRARLGFQQILSQSLRNIGSQGVKQWQELAASMAKDVLAANNILGLGNTSQQSVVPKDLVERFESNDREQILGWINLLTKGFCRIKTIQDPDIVRAIFWTLCEDEILYASNWLAGDELAQFKANDLRLPIQRRNFDAVLQILTIIAEYYDLVICFDELDILEYNDAGLHKSQIVANLVKELVENLKRGVIVTVMMPGTWQSRLFSVVPPSVLSKIMTFGPAYDLQYLDSNSAIDLVTVFLKSYYEARNLIPPYPTYPFDEETLKQKGKGKPTVREFLKWCRENIPLPPNGNILPPPNKVQLAFEAELREKLDNSMNDNSLISNALFFGFHSLINKTVENVTVQSVTTGVGRKGKKDPYLNFKILGKEQGREICIGVAVLQYDGGRALGAGFKRLLDAKDEFKLTRGCLVRSKTKLINSHFKNTYLTPLINKGGEFVDLKEEEIRPLIAIQAVYRKRESDYRVTEDEVLRFIEEQGEEYQLGIHNPILKEVLSDPSYQVPNDIIEEPEVSDQEVQNSEDSDLVDSNALVELVAHE
jgi:hypothetical protein